jgi:hypothetical protein
MSERHDGPEIDWKQFDAQKVEAMKAYLDDVDTDALAMRLRTLTYQLSTGKRRELYLGGSDPIDIYRGTSGIFESTESFNSDKHKEMMILELEGGFQTAFIRPDTVDYLVVPQHIFERGEADNFEELEADEARVRGISVEEYRKEVEDWASKSGFGKSRRK